MQDDVENEIKMQREKNTAINAVFVQLILFFCCQYE